MLGVCNFFNDFIKFPKKANNIVLLILITV